MDIKELKKQDLLALKQTLLDLLKEHFELRLQHSSDQLKDTSKLRKIKRSIAQAKTLIKEKSNA